MHTKIAAAHLQAALHHVVAIEVADEGHHPRLERINHQLDLHRDAGKGARHARSVRVKQCSRAWHSASRGACDLAVALPTALPAPPPARLLPAGQRLDELLHGARAVRVERHIDQLAVARHLAQHLRFNGNIQDGI